MTSQVFRVDRVSECQRAGPTDLIELLPVPGGHPLFVMKAVLETLVYGIVNHEFIHLSGPTGTAKSSLIEALYLVPVNFNSICRQHGYEIRPLKLYPIEMATYEAPGELYQRRAIKNGSTFDEASKLVEALQDAASSRKKCYPLVWLREMGRVHSSSVQGGLLNLMTKGDIVLPHGQRFSGKSIAWIADSNYQAEHDSTHTLVTLDDALKRRFTVNLTLDYLTAEQEVDVVGHLMKGELGNTSRRREGGRKSLAELRARVVGQGGGNRSGNGNGSGNGAGSGNESGQAVDEKDLELVRTVVRLGNIIRRQRLEGNLLSVPPPTIYGYLTFLRMANRLPNMTMPQVGSVTLLGNASLEDRKHVVGVLNEVFGLQAAAEDADPAAGDNLF